MNKFGIIGLGFIYNKHLEAITENRGLITWGCDIDETKQDKLPSSAKFVDNIKWVKDVDYVSILTPNYCHKEQAKYFLDRGIKVLTEKPPVISLKDYEELKDYKDLNVVLQLRHHPELIKWKSKIKEDENYDVKMKILVRRDQWYFDSWKGSEDMSGGLLFNIGVHYFDALAYLFGDVIDTETRELTDRKGNGVIKFKNANVNWELSLEAPMDNQKRLLEINGERLNLSQGFENLHVKVYEELLKGRGIHISECEKTIKLIENIKNGI